MQAAAPLNAGKLFDFAGMETNRTEDTFDAGTQPNIEQQQPASSNNDASDMSNFM